MAEADAAVQGKVGVSRF